MSKNTKNRWDVLVIGAGASGMMAAIFAARAGKQVIILEQSDKPGKKILATGNGKCNFTNAYMTSECFNGDVAYSERLLDGFTTEDCLAFFHSIGVFPKEKNGYYYPNSEQASSVVIAMTEELRRLSVDIRLQTKVDQIQLQKNGFCVCCNNEQFLSNKIIIATGLLAAPKLGSNGSLFAAIKDLGHHFSPIVPALCGFYCSGMNFKKVSGVRAIGRVSATIDGKIVVYDMGEVQFTDYGLSGIPVFQISRHISMGLYEKRRVDIQVDMLPDMSFQQLVEELKVRRLRNSTLEMFLNGLLNKKLGDALWDLLKLNPQMSVSSLSDKQLLHIAETIKTITVKVNKWRDYEFAQICAGGIPATEVHIENLESVYVKNLYFTGEILNIDGICGGYNLHFAWGSGRIAGTAAGNDD